MYNFLRSSLFLILFLPNISFSESLDSDQVNQFIEEMVKAHNFDTNGLRILFAGTKYSDKVLQAMSRPAEGLAWYKYRNIFLIDARIKQGVDFWKKYAATLNRAEDVYGVPPQIIIAIIGVETQYGKYKGNDKVMDSLATLAFHYPKRAKFFRSELEQFLLLTREQNVNPLSLKGSYAGAMGIPQFISSSYRNYAIDFDSDGKKDLWQNPVDAIGSVASYFNRHGWQAGQSVTFPVKVTGGKVSEIIDGDLKPNIRADGLSKYGITHEQVISESAMTKVMKFEQKDRDDYWLGLHNFYVITRYNHSALYAMAVYQLSEEIRKEYENKSAVEK
ncbi:MAG: membrane-bound lytic murein transglycosylase B [Gammaproteobacteria bacterium]|jgi:membrane-bound lytic murein transglycosylase B